jgi:hypothetical protein
LFMPGVPLRFSGRLTGPLGVGDAAWVVAGLQMMPALGRSKSTGLGQLQAEAVVRLDGQTIDNARLRAALQEASR